MPAKSDKQERFMRAVAHSPSFAKKVGVPMSVGREFTKKEGGMPITYKRDVAESEKRSEESDAMKRKAVSGMKKGGMAESKAMMKKEVSFMKKKGAPKSMIKHEMAEAGMKKMAKGGYAGGGMPMVMKDGQKVPAFAADGKGKMAKGGMAMKKMAGGGLAAGHKSADGIASKGKTKARQVTMAGSTGMKKGGMTKMKYGGKAC